MKKYLIWGMLLSLFMGSCGKSEEEPIDDSFYKIPEIDYQTFISSSEETWIPRPKDTYLYKTIPKERYWRNITKEDWQGYDRSNAIPDKVLKSMSTEGLIQSFFDFPGEVTRVYYTETTYLEPYQALLEVNKAYSELIKRKDAGTCMLKIYQECNFASGVGTLLMPVVEQLLADKNIYAKFSSDEIASLLDKGLERAKFVGASSSTFIVGAVNTFLFMGRILQYVQYRPFLREIEKNKDLSFFLKNQMKKEDFDDQSGVLHDRGIAGVIKPYVKQYLKNH
ncbi:MAG: hypothetical protein ACTTJK_05900 [Phocaeicola sp.]|uniref:hypothetical protein n=1 Tax=Phocaeicola sp. TaxID=2773926 RepID=UPI003FA013CF